eukprot:COSAG01_NODE_3705_length_5777_cov_19.676118_2_plen_112_part_00
MATEAYAAAMNEAIESVSRAEAERDVLVAHVAEMEATLLAVTTAAKDMHEKAFDMYWLGRRNIEEARHLSLPPAGTRNRCDDRRHCVGAVALGYVLHADLRQAIDRPDLHR